MRLERLDLTRYGKFTDRSLAFAPPKPGAPDLHILYGPNEAGKSTTLAAWLDLLFGIPDKSPYRFLHQSAMRVGARLDIGGQMQEVVRIKGRGATLLDAGGAALPEAVLGAGLGGIDLAGYRAMFSLDDDTIEAGGNSILASQGDLGQLLFSASAGLTGLGKGLETLRREADAFFRPRAQNTALNSLKARLDALEARKREIDTQAADYARLTAQEAQAHEEWAAVQARLSETQVALAAQRQLQAALPIYARWLRLGADLAPLSALPEPPGDWAALLPDLAQAQAATRARQEETAARITALERQLAALCPDPDVLAAREEIAAATDLKSAHDEAVKDLPHREEEATSAAQQIAALLLALGQPGADPAALRLLARTVAGLRALIETRSGVEARRQAAHTEATEAETAATEAAALLADAGGAPLRAEALAVLLASLRAQDPGGALRHARRQRALAEETLAPKLAALAPWRGGVEDLTAMAPPLLRQIDGWQAAIASANQARAAAEAEVARLQAQIARAEAGLAAQGVGGGPVDAATAAAVRSQREAAWAAHRARLDAGSADAFEAALRHDDRMGAAWAAQGAEVARDAQAQEALAVLRADLTGAEAAQVAAQGSQSAAVRALQAGIAALSDKLDPDQSAEALRHWLGLRDAALEAAAQVARARAEETAAEAAVSAARAALVAALAGAGADADPDLPYDTLMAEAQAQSDASTRLGALHATAAQARAVHQRRQAALAAAEAEADRWAQEWAGLAADSWLMEGGAAPEPDVMRALLDGAEALERAAATHAALNDRIAKMRANRVAFEAAVARLGQVLGMAEGAALWADVTARLTRADEVERARATALADHQAATRRAEDLAQERLKIDAQLFEMMRFFDASDVTDLREALTACARRQRLTAARISAEDEICEALAAADLAGALARLEAIDRMRLEADLAQYEARAQELTEAAQTAFAALSEARRQLSAVGGDDAAARLDEARETVLLEISEQASAHLRRRLGILAVDHALSDYRDSHRSAMMQRASEAFALISRGAYSGLAAQPDKDREVLLAMAADGSAKPAPDLSKGTRFQLYLALRVAGYHTLAETRRPVPFIADDIMETFDDDRSAEAFALLAQMATVGQVIYLTHHRHLCEIAQRVCPAAQITQLG
ncbi:AAA family ATPase [Phaeovulum sp.]|uniref:AAA family ATPase n=1 Tax=Phaeovulum sp. TaxID=2934796 RepID=UPI0039E2258A